ncbi:nucleoside triphosphate pyrophosphatase [Alcanivorax sp. 1008]|uniref:Maf family protein n=1 Tax=Alcanivorax sp. 1008 TaxID=2816853 RepID=UPI001D75EB16|nr:Maf family protein [Alcanivorax sp. 1008]MCC1495209.1 septum formation inhibitor Maf [Alcanivorax sp. 1008]
MRRLWLASASPRRAQLLASIGVKVHQVLRPEIDETPHTGESPEDYVRRMASEKAAVGWQRLAEQERRVAALLAADTSVVFDGQILGKPDNDEHARQMLGLLSAREHQVLSAVTVITDTGIDHVLSESRVRFATLSDADISAYVSSGEPMDKAGSYALQGFGALFVEHLSGSYSGVVGLPLAETGHLLRQAQVPIWQQGERN